MSDLDYVVLDANGKPWASASTLADAVVLAGAVIVAGQDYRMTLTVSGPEGVEATIGRDFEPEPEAPAPTLANLEPATAVVGGADVLLSCIGTGFTPGSVINFNGGDEPTTFVDETEVTTIVKPSTASGPWVLPVFVHNPDTRKTDSLDFTFTEEATP